MNNFPRETAASSAPAASINSPSLSPFSAASQPRATSSSDSASNLSDDLSASNPPSQSSSPPSASSSPASSSAVSINSQSQSQQQSSIQQSQSQSQSQSASQQSSQPPPSSSVGPSSVSQSQSGSTSGSASGSSSSDSASAGGSSASSTPASQPVLSASGSTATASPATTSFTTFTTNINGHETTVTSALPTSLAAPDSTTTTARRTAIIAGATAAGVGLVLLLLGAVFVYKRHTSRKREFSEALGRVRREAHGAGGVGLLDDEGFDDDDSMPMRRYHDNVSAGASGHSPSHSRDVNASSVSLGPPQSPAPSLFRQRAETGSLFREEGVWPPPGSTFVDPLVGLGAGDGLGKIVDEVMGPPPSHARNESSGSNFAHAEHRGNTPSMSSMYNDPFRDLSHSQRAPSTDPSLYYDRRGASSSLSTHSQETSGDRPTTPQSLLGLPAGAATPKKSSPLAMTKAPSSATWLTRSPRKGLSGSQDSHGDAAV
ncbi:hypothetical protein K438DRAFT_156920 [Mycena galopus ATCC 62051]|nr:hypothetical protein K438DRAFT_156920 [Mycena galopus ATCC 62051]